MDDHELRQLRIECVNELKSFVAFFNIGGVDHTHGGFCCGLSHAGKRLTDQKFVWFNGRGVWTYARLHRSGLLAHEPAPPHDDVHSDGMQGYLLQVAARAAAFAIEHGRDEAGAWIVELSGDGKRVRARRARVHPDDRVRLGLCRRGPRRVRPREARRRQREP